MRRKGKRIVTWILALCLTLTAANVPLKVKAATPITEVSLSNSSIPSTITTDTKITADMKNVTCNTQGYSVKEVSWYAQPVAGGNYDPVGSDKAFGVGDTVFLDIILAPESGYEFIGEMDNDTPATVNGRNPNYVTLWDGDLVVAIEYTVQAGSSQPGGGDTDTNEPGSGVGEQPTVSKPADDTEDKEAQRRREEKRREEAWKKSNANPDNYLPKVTGADGKEKQSTIASHYTDNREDGSIAAVFCTTPEQDFHAVCGIRTGSYAHMNAFASQCGPSLREAFLAYADGVGAALSRKVTVCDIFELQTEVRDKETYELLGTVKESSLPVSLVVALKGDALEQMKNGKESAVLCYADGEITLIKDSDTEQSAITMNTSKTSGIFAVIYAPAGTFDAQQ